MKYFDILLMSESLNQVSGDFFNMLRSAISRFHPESLSSVTLYFSPGKNICYVLFRFDFHKFLPSYLNWFTLWIDRMELRAIDLMKLHENERTELLERIERASEKKFTTPFDFEIMQREIESQMQGFEDRRRHERVRAVIKVKFIDPREFFRRYTEDISKGGIFIKTSSPLPYDTNVKIILTLPDSSKITLMGRVVYVLDEKNSMATGKPPGMGIQFIDVSPEISRTMEELIEKIKQMQAENARKKQN